MFSCLKVNESSFYIEIFFAYKNNCDTVLYRESFEQPAKNSCYSKSDTLIREGKLKNINHIRNTRCFSLIVDQVAAMDDGAVVQPNMAFV